MLSEQRKVLTMVRDGKVSVEEAEQMLHLLDRPDDTFYGQPQVELEGMLPLPD